MCEKKSQERHQGFWPEKLEERNCLSLRKFVVEDLGKRTSWGIQLRYFML